MTPDRRLVGRVVAVAVLLLTMAVGFVSHTALRSFEAELRPELEREATIVGSIGAGTLQRALDLGVPFAGLSGLEEYLTSLLAARQGLAYVLLTDATGQRIAGAGETSADFAGLQAGTAAPERGALMRLLGGSYDAALPVLENGVVAGWLHVGIARARLDTALDDMRWDVLIVLLVVLLATTEFLRFVLSRTVAAPIGMVLRLQSRLAGGDWTLRAPGDIGAEAGRVARHLNVLVRRMNDRWDRLCWMAAQSGAAARAGAVLDGVRERLRFGVAAVQEGLGAGAASARLPLFLFVFAEQLSTSFNPIFALELAGGQGGIMGAALPIVAFVAAVALFTPFGGGVVARHGPRDALLIGLLPAALGHVGAALATDLTTLAIARAVCGAGYAIVTIACQVHLAQEAPQGRVARSLGGFTAAVMTGAVCGTAIGAVLADRVGFRVTLVFSMLLVAGTALLVWRAFAAGGASEQKPVGLWQSARAAFAEPRFALLVLFAAIPAKVLLGGFIFFLAPLELREMGLSQAAIGRNVMLYGLCMLPAILVGAWLTDRTGRGGLVIAVAGVVNGMALLLPLWLEREVALPLAIIGTGLAQGLAAAPMLAIIPGLSLMRGAPSSAAMLSFLRLGERFGSVIGPPAAAALLALGTGQETMLALGVLSLATAIGYALSLAFQRSRQKEPA
ncbi:MFS transporter [Falsiroseomonas sp.]|uniref:MFS transporter n=1 Tax=Falsiroseomonas sp. TaxID=2870721 RepID=UPI0027291F87|nr:MFS transporter [Falsiroseomonas sp.]MDO9502509.1 MFS transporter [Falsiroseomonas sp.]